MNQNFVALIICFFTLPAFSQAVIECTATSVHYTLPFGDQFSTENSQVRITPETAQFGKAQFSVAQGDRITFHSDHKQTVVNVTIRNGQERLRVWIPKASKKGRIDFQEIGLDHGMAHITCK